MATRREQNVYFRGPDWARSRLKPIVTAPDFTREDYKTIRDTIFEIIDTYKPFRDGFLRQYWAFYHGNSKAYAPAYKGETQEEHISRLNWWYEANRVGPICDKHAGYLYGRANEIVRRCKDAKAQKHMQRVWEFNDVQDGSIMLDTALMAIVSGFTVVCPKFVDERTAEPFDRGVPIEERRKYGIEKYILTDSTHAMLLPQIKDARKLGAVILTYYDDSYSAPSTLERFTLGDQEYTRDLVVEYIDDYYWIKFTDGGNKMVRVNENYPVFRNKNFYASVEIPFVVFRNGGDPMLLEGTALPDGLMNLNLRLNERLTDDALAISHHQLPILKILNASLPSGFKRTHNTILELQSDGAKDADAEYLVWEDALEASDNHEDKILSLIDDEGEMSAVDWGDVKALGQVRSADGIRAATRASQEATNRRKRYFSEGEKWLIRSTLQMHEIHTFQRFESYASSVIYPDFITPTDLSMAQTDQIKLLSGQMSFEDYVKRHFPELATEQEINAKVEELKKTVEMLQSPNKGAREDPISAEERSMRQTQ